MKFTSKFDVLMVPDGYTTYQVEADVTQPYRPPSLLSPAESAEYNVIKAEVESWDEVLEKPCWVELDEETIGNLPNPFWERLDEAADEAWAARWVDEDGE